MRVGITSNNSTFTGEAPTQKDQNTQLVEHSELRNPDRLGKKATVYLYYRAPLELHLVHYKEDYEDVTDAATNGGAAALAVVGFLFKVRMNLVKKIEMRMKSNFQIRGKDNPWLAPIIDGLSAIKAPDAHADITEGYNLVQLLKPIRSSLRSNFYR